MGKTRQRSKREQLWSGQIMSWGPPWEQVQLLPFPQPPSFSSSSLIWVSWESQQPFPQQVQLLPFPLLPSFSSSFLIWVSQEPPPREQVQLLPFPQLPSFSSSFLIWVSQEPQRMQVQLLPVRRF